MQWYSDDFSGESVDLGYCEGESSFIPDYPAEIELLGLLDDPLTAQELDLMIDQAELMGIDLDDPELMGAFFKKLISKIKARFAKKKKKPGAAPSPLQPTGIQVTTPAGVAKLGPGGLSFVGKQPVTVTPTGKVIPVTAQPATGGMMEMLKNPFVIGGLIGVPLLLMMMAGRRKKK